VVNFQLWNANDLDHQETNKIIKHHCLVRKSALGIPDDEVEYQL
jgi:hypothetical protein